MSISRLQGSHMFHLDCIGSTINSRRLMQCLYCCVIERENWHYARNPVSLENVNSEDWVFYEEPYEFVDHLEVFLPLFVFPFCHIVHMSEELPHLFGELEASQETPFHDAMRQNFYAEPISISEPGTSQEGAYLAYFWSLLPSSSTNAAERIEAGSAYYGCWNPLTRSSDGESLHRAHPIDFHDYPWAPISTYYSLYDSNTDVVEQPRIPTRAMRMGRIDIGSQQRGSLPSFYGNRSERPEIPCAIPMAPQLIRVLDSINEQGCSSLFTRSRGSGLMRQPLGAANSFILPRGSAFSGSSSVGNSEGLGGNNIYYIQERAPFGPHSSINNERVWPPSSSQQQGSAPMRLFRQWVGSSGP